MATIAGSLFAISQLESMKKKLEMDRQLEEVTIEDKEQREQGKEPVSSNKGLENIQEADNRGERPVLRMLRKEIGRAHV